MSGAGKSYAIKCFEDMGFFCVDNLPTTLIPTFADLVARSTHTVDRVALGVDVREGEYLTHLLDTLAELRKRGHTAEVLFLEASEESLVRRYRETRRRHPLAPDGNVLDGIRAERKVLSTLREVADRMVDSSALTVHQLKDLLVEHYVTPGPAAGPVRLAGVVRLQARRSVRRRSGVRRPLPAQPALRGGAAAAGRPRQPGAGLRHEAEESRELLRRLEDFLGFVLPAYQREGKAYLTVAVGCTGGRHRSVALVEELRGFLDRLGLAAGVVHRDLDRE